MNFSEAIPGDAGTHRFQSFCDRWQGAAPHNYAISNNDLRDLPSLMRSRGSQHDTLTISRDVSSRFGRRLRELRLDRNLTQSDMAKKFGIDRSFISDVERGRKSISLPMLEVIALGLKVSLSQLFDGL